MKAQEIFISSILVLLFFNFIYISSTPNKVNTMTIGAITGLLTLVIAVGVIGGLQILGSGLNSASIKIIFSVGVLVNIMFRIEMKGVMITLAGYPLTQTHLAIGLGLMNNLYEVFSQGDLLGIGFFITTVFSIITLVSGLIIIIGGLGGGE